MKAAVICAALILLVSVSQARTSVEESRAEMFCTLGAKYFSAFLPPALAKKWNTGMCKLGSVDNGEVDIYFPTLGTDSLERERIITIAINAKPIDEPELGEKAFSILNDKGLLDTHKRRYYTVQYYARKNAQIFSITFKQYRPFTAGDFASAKKSIKAFFDELD